MAAWQGLRGIPPGAAGRTGNPHTLLSGLLADGWHMEDGALGHSVDDTLALLSPALCQGPDEDPSGDVSVSFSLLCSGSGVEWAMLGAWAGGWECKHCGCRLLQRSTSLRETLPFLPMVVMASGKGHGNGSHKIHSQV